MDMLMCHSRNETKGIRSVTEVSRIDVIDPPLGTSHGSGICSTPIPSLFLSLARVLTLCKAVWALSLRASSTFCRRKSSRSLGP
jgi:hypothetical protein